MSGGRGHRIGVDAKDFARLPIQRDRGGDVTAEVDSLRLEYRAGQTGRGDRLPGSAALLENARADPRRLRRAGGYRALPAHDLGSFDHGPSGCWKRNQRKKP